MNWYKKSMSVPQATGYTPTHWTNTGIRMLDKSLSPQDVHQEIQRTGPLDLLGTGEHGAAYNLQAKPGRVMKYTTDPTEAQSAKTVMLLQHTHDNQVLPGIIGVYSVKQIPNKNVWSIETEKVAPLDTQYDHLTIQTLFFIQDHQPIITPQTIPAITKYIQKKMQTHEPNKPFDEKILTQYLIMCSHLQEYGLKPNDAMAKNIGWRNDGTLVLLDLGYAT